MKSLLQKFKLNTKEQFLIETILEYKEIPRTKLLKLSGLKNASFYRSIDKLSDLGFIIVSKSTTVNPVGRPCDIVEINPSFGLIYSVVIRRDSYRIAFSDFAQNILFSKKFSCDNTTEPEALIDNAKNEYLSYLKDNQFNEKEDVIGVAVSSFDVKLSYSFEYPGFNWAGKNTTKLFLDKFDKDIFFEHGAPALASGLYYPTYMDRVDNFASVIIDEGIGLGLILNHSILKHNTQKFNGLGYMVIDINGPKSICGIYGCVESYSSNLAIVNTAKSELKKGRDSILSNKIETLTISDICEAEKKGDQMAIDVISNAARIFSIGVTNLINLINIQTIIFSGFIINNSSLFFNIIQKQLEKKDNDLIINKIDHENESELSTKGIVLTYLINIIKK